MIYLVAVAISFKLMELTDRAVHDILPCPETSSATWPFMEAQIHRHHLRPPYS